MKFELLCGDAIDKLRSLPDKSVNACVTSPPYYGLRDYGTGKWVGGDPNCMHSSAVYNKPNLRPRKQTTNVGTLIEKSLKVCPDCGAVRVDNQIGLEETPDDYISRLVEVFREVKRVLRDDGILWVNIGDTYNGSKKGNTEIYKHKSCSDANQNFKKKLWDGAKPKDLIGIPWMLAFALRADGWYLRQDIIWAKNNPMPESVKDRCTRSHEYIFMLTKNKKYWFDHEAMQEPTVNPNRKKVNVKKNGYNGVRNFTTPMMNGAFCKVTGKRNKRDVWQVSVCSTVKEAHFAVFPKELIMPCVSAGCPEGGTVLDPFSGSGTTGIVAVQNNRNYIGIELNPEYIEITKRRIEKEIGNEKHEVSVR